MKLSQLLGCEKKLAESEIKGITNDSRKVEKGFVFVNTAGVSKYDEDAIAKGAIAIVTDQKCDFENVITVSNTARTFAEMSATWFGNPAKDLKLLGVTGTNGKTSVTYMLKSILENAGKKVGLIGTNMYMSGDKKISSVNTTPNAYHLNELFRQMKNDGCEYVVMEVSSHSLIFESVYGLDFEIAMFTNLTQDHLDFHNDMETYFKAKKKLFSACKTAVINADDEYGERLIDELNCKTLTYSVDKIADYTAKAVNCRATNVSYKLLRENITHIKVNTGGNFTVYNSLCAIVAALEIGISMEIITAALEKFGGVTGRAEVIPNTGDFSVIIDYAHTPDGLKNILKTFKKYTENRLIVLFGCGGDRDSKKRPLMGEIASIYADYVLVTTDNPRTEEPKKIIDDIMKGIPAGLFHGKIIENRTSAIKYALSIAQKGDIIILAGKGHEDYQIIGKEKISFSEREIVRKCLDEMQ